MGGGGGGWEESGLEVRIGVGREHGGCSWYVIGVKMRMRTGIKYCLFSFSL